MRINNNIMSLNAHRQLGANQAAGAKSMERLSSGLRINRAGDDAAGLAISEKMRGQIRGLKQASRNAQDGISLIQTAEGNLNETHSILQRMKELATQASNDTLAPKDRNEIQNEMNQLTSEINRIANTAEFNTKSILNGDLKGTKGTANHASATFTFNVADDEAGTTKLNIGGEEYEIVFNGTAAYDNDEAATVDAGNKKITINTGTTAPTETQLADKLVDAFKTMRGEDPSLSLTEFTFTNDSGSLKIAANSTGDYAGASGKDSISFVSGRSVTMGNITEGSNGAEGKAQLQIGANNGQAFVISINDMSASSLGIAGSASGIANGHVSIEGATPDAGTVGATFTAATSVTNGTSDSGTEAGLDVSTHENATKAIEVVDMAITLVSAERSKLGAYQNRLEHTISNLGTSAENLQAAESRIRDLDMAEEMMSFTKSNILNQAATAMLAQANMAPQSVLQLLG